ncbi:MAG: S8 family serine peptidase [Candidatus Marinimicrobia bacterium]|nr:S8 family serine peptidase [Candidatus Neomarinimicrobiota bacterium]
MKKDVAAMLKKHVCKILFFLTLQLLFVTGLGAVPTSITSPLRDRIEFTEADELIRINILLTEQIDTQRLYSEAKNMIKSARRAHVINTLEQFSADKQKSLLSELQSFSKNNSVTNIQPLWIANVVTCSATPSVIQSIANRHDISRIDYDELRNMLLSNEPEDFVQYTADPNNREITWNVTLVNANDVWTMGYTGSGVLVSVIDTGVNYNHQDLQDHMWNGGLFYPHHGYNFNDDDNDPMDDHGHGTHCSGTVAGDGTAGSQTGMAPDAMIMACKVLDATGNGYESDVWEAIQFSVERGADIMSISLGWMHSWGPDRTAWRTAMNNALSAGLIASVAAANSGNDQVSYPIPDNVATPGDIPPPWLNPDQTLTGGVSAVVCVGATNSSDVIASFSSRGPVTWSSISGFNDYPYDPEMGLIRPDISAPGVDIKSLSAYSDTGYESGWDGTSMATPCVAGVMALMLSKEPTLMPEQISQFIEETAVHYGSPGKNNSYGSGRVDAYEAVNAIFTQPIPPNPVLNPNPENFAQFTNITTNLYWSNGGGATSFNVYFGTDNPPTNIFNGEYVTSSSFTSLPTLDFNTEYFWKVDATNDYGTTEGFVWSFTTTPPADEDFEMGDFSAYNWTFGGNADWTMENDNPFNGAFCVRSGDINSNQTSSLFLELNVVEDGAIRFWKRVSCEQDPNDDWDYLAFFIDDVEYGRWDGEVSWSEEDYAVSQGLHTFEWRYRKDGAVDSGADAAWIDFITLPPQFIQVSTAHIADWNIVGLPLDVTNDAPTDVYPNAIENTCYAYNSDGYALAAELSMGAGYWLRFTDAGNRQITGVSTDELTLQLEEGWNLISGIHSETNVNDINDLSEIIVPYTVYGFSPSGYANSETLSPGQGYWVRSTSNGEITITSVSSRLSRSNISSVQGLKNANTLTLNGMTLYFGVDISEKRKLSYSLPPKPPMGAFDVRFEGGWKIADSFGLIEVVNPFDALNVGYNINNGERWELIDNKGNVFDIAGNGIVEIEGDVTTIELRKSTPINLPEKFALKQNYPNPFNPVTTITYQLPEASYISLAIYNLMGQQIKTLHAGNKTGGTHSVTWKGKNNAGESMASGMYFCMLKTNKFTDMKKIILMK